MFEIRDRACKIGNHVNVRTEARGDEEVVTAFDISIVDISLDKGELNTLLGDEQAHERLFRTEEGGRIVPAFNAVQSLRLKAKIPSARVEIHVGQGKAIVMPDAKLSKVTLERRDGGVCGLGVQVQCIPNIDEGGARLLKHLGADAGITIRTQNEQQGLDLKEINRNMSPSAVGMTGKPHRGRASTKGEKVVKLPGARKGRKRNGADHPTTPSAA